MLVPRKAEGAFKGARHHAGSGLRHMVGVYSSLFTEHRYPDTAAGDTVMSNTDVHPCPPGADTGARGTRAMNRTDGKTHILMDMIGAAWQTLQGGSLGQRGRVRCWDSYRTSLQALSTSPSP